MLTEVQESHSLDLILGEMGSPTFTETSELPAISETSTAVTMSQDMGLSIFNEDKAWRGPSEIDLNQMDTETTCRFLGSDLMSLSSPMAYQPQTDDLKFDDKQTGRQISENKVPESSVISEYSEIVESRWSTGKGDEGKESLGDFSASYLLEPAPSSSEVAEKRRPQKTVEENLMSQQLLHPEPELLFENEKSVVYTVQNCEGIDQPKRKDVSSLDLVKPARKPLNPSFSEQNILSDISCRYITKENQPARSPLGRKRQSQKENLGSPPIKSSTKSNSCSIWSRRGKPATALQLQTGSNRGQSRSAAFDSENVNCEDKIPTRDLFADSDGEEIFTPDKENLTPNTRKLKFLKEIGEVGSSSKVSFSPKICPSKDVFRSSDQENCTPMKKTFTPKSLQPKLGKASEVSFSSDSYPGEDIFHPSDKENRTPEFQREHGRVKSSSRSRSRLVKEISGAKGRERMPFQSLLINLEMESHSSGHGALRSSSSVEFAGTMGKKVSGFISVSSQDFIAS